MESVTLPTVLVALLVQREWRWLSVPLLCSVGAVGLLAARALIHDRQAHPQVRALQTLHRRLIAHLHPDHLLQELSQELRRLLLFDRLSLWYYARQEAHLQIVGVYLQQARAAFPASLQVESILGRAIDSKKPLVLTDTLRARLHEATEHLEGHVLIIPLAVHEYPWGMLILERSVQREPFVRADYETIQEELSRSLCYHHPTTVLMIDVGYSKRYNDTYGH